MSEAMLREAWRLHRAGDHAEAERLYKDILRSEPQSFDALFRLGFLYGERGRFEEAQSLIGEALKLDPAAADLHFLRGSALLSLGRFEEAVASFDRALALAPDFPEALLNRAAASFRLKRHAAAAEDYDRLLRRYPDYPYARGNRLFCRLHGCDWRSLDEDCAAIAAALKEGKRAVAPFDAKALPLSAAEELVCAKIWAADQAPPAPQQQAGGEPYRHERIRVAYLAARFGDDPVSSLIAAVIECHDRRKFEFIGVSFEAGGNGAMQARFRRAFERSIEGAVHSDFALASLLRGSEVDIAVDLMGFTEGSRPGVFAARAAPVQASYLGFPGTMGAPYIDYILADRIVVPEKDARHYSEKIVYLPDSYQCNDRKRAIAARGPGRREAGLPETGFVFACFNNTYKFSPPVFDIWMRLLGAVEGSVLWLPRNNPIAAGNLRREALARGVAPERLVFAPFLPSSEDHLARLRLADLFVDTLPYNAHTTASDALWAGLPVLTCAGDRFAGRVAASLLLAAGLPELVTHSPGDYERLALALARDPGALSAIRAKLAGNRDRCRLFDTATFTRHLEAAFAAMCERQRRGLPPASFAVGDGA